MNIRAFLLSTAVILGAACGGSSGPSTPPPPPPPPPPPAPGTVNVGSAGNTFDPTAVTVTRGATVTWNFVGGTHNVTFEDGAPASSDMSSGSFTRNFANAGTFRFRRGIHTALGNFSTGMVGQVVVQ